MAGWSLGWGVREMGRRMSGETRIGGRVAKMSLNFFLDRFSLLLEGGEVCVYSSWDLAVEYIYVKYRTRLDLLLVSRCERFIFYYPL